MSVIQLQCKNCKMPLEVDDSYEFAECPYCGFKYKLDDDVYIQNKTNITHIEKAESLNVQGSVTLNNGPSAEELIESANTYLYKLNEIDEARSIFKTLTKKYPYIMQGWWGLASCDTFRFSFFDMDNNSFKLVQKNVITAKKVANEEERKYIDSNWDQYTKKRERRINEKLRVLHNDLNDLSSSQEVKDRTSDRYKKELSDAQLYRDSIVQALRVEKSKSSWSWLVVVGIIFLLIGSGVPEYLIIGMFMIGIFIFRKITSMSTISNLNSELKQAEEKCQEIQNKWNLELINLQKINESIDRVYSNIKEFEG